MLTYRERFILFRGNYTNSLQARLHTGKMLMDSADICMRGLLEKLKEKVGHKIEDLQQP